MIEQALWTVLLLLVVVTTSTYAACNGHGSSLATNLTNCTCERPYTGPQCELCEDGYYGNPADGQPCFSVCGHSKHITNFTTAGVGVNAEFLLDNPPEIRGNLCVWVIDPSSQIDLEAYDSTLCTESSNHSLSFHISSSLHPSVNQSLLVYEGLPAFLKFTNPQLQLNSSFQSFTQQTFYRHNLVYSLSGDRLDRGSLMFGFDVVTVVYLYSNAGGAVLEGDFNLTISVGGRNSSLQNESDYDVIDREHPLITTLIPSLSSLLSQQSADMCLQSTNQIAASNYTQNCSGSPSCHGNMDCNGRYWHSMVYNDLTDSLWLFGGLDVGGVVCQGLVVVNLSRVAMDTCEECVRSVRSEPSGRYLHTAVLSKCPNETGDSCMLVFGGFPSMADLSMPSRELWLYSDNTESWSRLADAPEGFGLAAHSSVMVANDTMLVVGGVRNGQVSSHVLTYSVDSDQWSVWDRGPVPGLYGQSAVYDEDTDSVYLYGGVVYARPSADVSSSLFVLHVATRSWAEVALAVQTPPRLFHSMVLVNRTLFISGGLTNTHPDSTTSRGLANLTLTDTYLLVDLASNCDTGKTALITTGGSHVWGHSLALYRDTQVLLSGGFAGGKAVDSVSLQEVPSDITCSLATNTQQCQAMPFCDTCINGTDFVSCYDLSDTWQCNGTNEQILSSNNNCTLTSRATCGQFGTCRDCLTFDLSQETGCVWCGCTLTPICTDSPSNCPSGCSRVANGYGDIEQVCPVDFCSAPSCQDCLSDRNCGWSHIKLTPNLNQTDVTTSSGPAELGCYSKLVNERVHIKLDIQVTIDTCSSPCSLATSCQECVQLSSLAGGPLFCIWSTYTDTCMSHDLAPLTCADGLCGGFVNIEAQCPLECQAHDTCKSCLSDPKCTWYFSIDDSTINVCSNAQDSLNDLTLLSLNLSPNSSVLHQTYTSECLQCPLDCSGRGTCNIRDLTCSCDLGYIGEGCEVECACNGLSYCVNATDEGRRDCLQCQHNTQGLFCTECQPFSVGRPGNGMGCVPCWQYCHGNSDICVRRSEVNETMQGEEELASLLGTGPSAEEAVCVSCAEGSTGERCDICIHGYHDNNQGQSTNVSCKECPCNGHGSCDPLTGSCDCQNNTRSNMCTEDDVQCSLNTQCNLCISGYIGTPSNNHQCYRELSIETVKNFTIRPNQAISMAIGFDYFFSNVDVRVNFVLRYGRITIYDSISERAVSIRIDEETFEHIVQVEHGFELTRVARDAVPSQDGAFSDNQLSEMVSKRQVVDTPATVALSLSQVFVHEVTAQRYTLVIPHDQPGFQIDRHFLTILAGDLGTEVFVYYQQQSPRLNYYMFFSVLVTSFLLTFALSLLIWKGIKLEGQRRRRAAAKRLAAVRASRPFAKVTVFFDRKRLKDVKEKQVNPLLTLSEVKGHLKRMSEVKATPTEVKEQVKGEQFELRQCTKPEAQKKRSKHKVVPKVAVNPCDLEPWPIALQPSHDERVCVGTVLVKLPSRSKVSRAHVICTGTCLASRRKEVEKRRWKFGNNRLVPVTGLEIESSTTL